VPGFLSPQGADDLYQAMAGDLPWNRAFNGSDRHFDVPLAAFEALAPDAHAALDQDGHVSEGYTPAYNALNLFRVPQRHAVSYVAPFAGAPRLAITGWIREGQDQ
jgi:hypothetical protein